MIEKTLWQQSVGEHAPGMLKVSIGGSLKMLSRLDLEEYIEQLDKLKQIHIQGNTRVRSGIQAVIAAGCERKRLGFLLRDCKAFFIPPSSINPDNQVMVVCGDEADIQKFIDAVTFHTVTTSLSVTQLWWLRRQQARVEAILMQHGAAMCFGKREMSVHACSGAILNQCLHELFQVLSEFVDCKIKTPNICDSILQLAHQHDCFAVWHDGVLEVQGAKQKVKSVLESQVSVNDCDAKFIGTHPFTDKDFICGKKDGKLLKIMRECKTKIGLKDLSEHLLQVSVTGPSFEQVWQAAGLVDDELPTVMVKHVPQFWHRKLIGRSGKNIQRIMKKHGVYIKFFSRSEAESEFGGSKEWSMPASLFVPQNLLIKTPTKNGPACHSAYLDILSECDWLHGESKPDEAIFSVEAASTTVLQDNQLIAFKNGSWTMLTFNNTNMDLTARKPIVDKDAQLFSLFPFAFSTAPSRRLSVGDANDEIWTGSESESTSNDPGVVGMKNNSQHQQQSDFSMSQENVDKLIEALLETNLSQNRRNSLNIFEL